MTTREITGTILRADGSAWDGAVITFSMNGSAHDLDSHYPRDRVSAQTDENGLFSIELDAGLPVYWQCQLPRGDRFYFYLEDGDSITLEELRSLAGFPEGLIEVFETQVAQMQSDLTIYVLGLLASHQFQIQNFFADRAYPTLELPDPALQDPGMPVYDTTRKMPLWSDGERWRDAEGNLP